MEFLDNRDEKGQFLGFSINPISYQAANLCLDRIKKNPIFKILAKHFDEKLLELYFKKHFYELFFETSCKIVLSKHIQKDKIIEIRSSFPFIDCLNTEFSEFKKIKFIKKKRKKILKSLIRNYLIKNSNILYSFIKFFTFNLIFQKEKNIDQNKIAVNYIEGSSFNKRSDFFWYKKDLFKNSEVLAYIDEKKRFDNYGNKNDQLKKLKENGIIFVEQKRIKYLKPTAYFQDIKKKICSLKKESNFENNWLKEHSLILISKIQFWYNFFSSNNIKIHFNSHEMGPSNIIRQIAVKLVNGCSIGKLRSIPTNIDGDFLGFYPNDVFFTWGEDSYLRIKRTENQIKKILISGDPYPPGDNNINEKFLEKLKQLKNNGSKFIIMLIDSGYSDNNKIDWQFTHTLKMKNFFQKFLNLIENNRDIGIIVKSKKRGNLKNLGEIYNKIKLLELKNKSIFMEDNNEISAHYSKYADITISIGAFIPGSLIQCVINNKNNRAVMYDDSNIRSYEKRLYEKGYNKIIFDDLELLIEKVLELKKNLNEKNINNIGIWKDINFYDPFCDGDGGKRIGKFVRKLLDDINSGTKIKDSINNACEYYKKHYRVELN